MKKRASYFKDPFRPEFHYTAQSHIINDPNGLFFFDGEYHLMHQYNIHNHIHWGHAVSRDLMHWEHLPPALAPDSIGQIWSGSVVIDWRNTSGLQIGCNPVFIAVFTYNEHTDSQQSQGLAYSNDRGRTWQKYKYNPVLTSGGKKDFRDPKVFWYSPDACWIMVLACFDHAEFYRSENLTEWTYAGQFGTGEGAEQGIWECPDLFMLEDKDTGEMHWVLTVSVNDGAPAGGTGMQYFVGGFDGFCFYNANSPDTVLWVDYGKDFYAGVTWNDIPDGDGRRLMIAWADNWLYRDLLPTELFKGQFSTVRELSLKRGLEGLRLVQSPAGELSGIYGVKQSLRPCLLMPDETESFDMDFSAFEFQIHIFVENSDGKWELRLLNDAEEAVAIGVDLKESCLYLDRTAGSRIKIPHFEGVHTAPLTPKENGIDLRVLVDSSQIEVFCNNGETVITDLAFPSQAWNRLTFSSLCSTVAMSEGIITVLNSVWEDCRSWLPRFSQVVSGSWADTSDGLEGDCKGEGILISEEEEGGFIFSTRVKLMPLRSGGCAGILFGIRGGSYFLAAIDKEHGVLSLYHNKKVLKETACQLNMERVYRMKVEAWQEAVAVYLDDIELIRLADAGYEGGNMGLYVNNTVSLFIDSKLKKL